VKDAAMDIMQWIISTYVFKYTSLNNFKNHKKKMIKSEV